MWSYANIPICCNPALFKSVFLSTQQYGLESIWLNKCEHKRLRVFYCKCLRRIMKIQHSFFKRISNIQVLTAADKADISIIMIKQQLQSFRGITTSNYMYPLRHLECDNDHRFRKFNFNPIPVGRLKQCWLDEAYKICSFYIWL